MAPQSSFHALRDSTEASETAALALDYPQAVQRHLGYDFSLHQHPYVTDLVQRLLEKSVGGLQGADTENPPLYDSKFFDLYHPNPAVVATRPVKDLDFDLAAPTPSTTGSCSSTSR